MERLESIVNIDRDHVDKVEIMWECDLKKLGSQAQEYIKQRTEYYKTIDKVGTLNPRDAFYGGRTNNLCFFHCTRGGFCNCSVCLERGSTEERIEYKDFTSEYPWVLKNQEFPIVTPEIITEDFGPLSSYFGLMKLKILPPSTLRIPVLPLKARNKLLFALCAPCAISGDNVFCTHDDGDRALVGAWATPEIELAVEMGYQILEIYEVLHYPQTSKTLFVEYVNTFLKVKQENSDWPDKYKDDEAGKQNYIREYKEKENIELEYAKVQDNPVLRSIAKLMLNSFWGKFAQRPNLKKTTIVTNYNQLHELISNEKIEIKGQFLVEEDTLMVSHEMKTDEDCKPGNTSIVIASFVTAYARISLYRQIALIERDRAGRLLYMDTDSLLFTTRANEYTPECGNYLGQMTCEIEKDFGKDAKCTRFASTGPKSYGYEVTLPDDTNRTIMKMKGIRLSAQILDDFNFQRLFSMAEGYTCDNPSSTKFPQMQFRSDRHHVLQTFYMDKAFRVVSTKRIVRGNETYPFGYKQNNV